MYQLRGLFIQTRSDRKSKDIALIIWKSLIPKKFDTESEDLLFMILELCTSVVSCFRTKVITKNIALF